MLEFAKLSVNLTYLLTLECVGLWIEKAVLVACLWFWVGISTERAARWIAWPLKVRGKPEHNIT